MKQLLLLSSFLLLLWSCQKEIDDLSSPSSNNSSSNTCKLATSYAYGLLGQGLVKTEENLFQYTGNNITKSIRLDYGLAGSTTASMDTTVIEYDVQPNNLKKQGFPFMLADPAYINTNVIVDYYVLFMSENNPVKVYDSQFPAESQTVTYARDAKGNVLEIKSGGDPLASYKYKCL